MIRLLIGMVCIQGLAAQCLGDSTELLSGLTNPESAVGYSPSTTGADGGYFITEHNGNAVSLVKVSGAAPKKMVDDLKKPRGLAIKDNKHLFVATDEGVKHYEIAGATVDETTLTLKNTYTSADAPNVNGLCIDANGEYLYATEPAWKLMPWGPTDNNPFGALIQFKISDGTAKTVMQSAKNGFTPNGCTVATDGKVYMVHFTYGVTSWDPVEDQHSGELQWSTAIKADNNKKIAGDGIVWDAVRSLFYVSTWSMSAGAMYTCDPAINDNFYDLNSPESVNGGWSPSGACTADNNVKGADIKIDTLVDDTLLVPSMMAGTLSKVKITCPKSSGGTTAAPSGSNNSAGTNGTNAASAASSADFLRPTTVATTALMLIGFMLLLS